MNREELVEYFQTHKGSHRRSCKEVASRTHSKLRDVLDAKIDYRNSRIIYNKERKVLTPKILIFDIETAPMQAYVWKLWKENVSLDQIQSDWFIICWSAKWLYSTDVMGDCLTSEEILAENDSRVVKSLWELFNEADIIIAHNGNKFDVPKANSRFIINGLTPPSPYRTIDTLIVARKQFGFASNKLDALATYLGIENKLSTDFELWRRCMEGDQIALNYMFEYNKKDVEILEEVYLKLLPWIRNHPNISVYTNDLRCSKCGHKEVELTDKYYYTQVGKYPVYRCKQCGAYTRARKSIKLHKLSTNSV